MDYSHRTTFVSHVLVTVKLVPAIHPVLNAMLISY